MADDLGIRAGSWLQALWAQRAVDALAEAGAFAGTPTAGGDTYSPPSQARVVIPQAQAMRWRLARIAGGDALSEACEALGDVLAIALARNGVGAGETLSGLIGAARHPVLLTNGARWFLEANAAATRLLGSSPEELRSHRLDDFVPRRWRRALASRWSSFETAATSAGALLLIAAGGQEVSAGYTAASNLASDRHLIVIERVDGVRFGVWSESAAAQRRAPILRPREREVLALVAAGRTSAGIAIHLELSRNTVESHIRNAVVRLGASNRTHAVVIALARGEIELPEPEDRSQAPPSIA